MVDKTLLDQILLSLPNKHIMQFAADALILRQGDVCNEMFYILKGSVRTVLLTPQGDEILMTIHEAGEFICEASYAKYKRSMLSLYAMDETELISLSSMEYNLLLTRYPELSNVLMVNMAQKLDLMVNQLDQYTSSGTLARIANVLLLFAEKYGVQTETGIRIDHRLTDTELGTYVGAKRESVNRALKKLKDDHIILKNDGFLHVLDLEKLSGYRDKT